MEVICLKDDAFYALFDEVVLRIMEKHQVKEDKWISEEEAMALMRIRSKTTLQKFRDENKIRYSHPAKKIILYDRASIYEFLERHAKNAI